MEPEAAQLLPVRLAEVMSGDQPPVKLCADVEVGRARTHIEGSVDAENLRFILERVGR